MGLWKKFIFYKRLFIVIFFLNILCISVGITLGVGHFSLKQEMAAQLKERTFVLGEIGSAMSKLDELLLLYIEANSKDTESLYQKRRLSEEVQGSLNALVQNGIIELNYKREVNRRLFLAEEVAATKKVLADKQKEFIDELTALNLQLLRQSRELVSIAILTLVLGFILPALILLIIGRIIWRIKRSMEKMVREWVTEWIKSSSHQGQEFYKSMEFWSNMILFTMEKLAPYSQQAMIHYLGEMASMIRRELKKTEEVKT